MLWILGVFILCGLAVSVLYNQLVRRRNAFRNAFAQIDVQLTRRYDLIPNLVKVAERYMKHERETLEAVIAARNQALGMLRQVAADPADVLAVQRLAESEQGLSGLLGKLFAVSESYPELRADQTMNQLSEELVSTENRIAFARQAFNDAVMFYNNQRETFPGNVIAGMFGFRPARMLEIESPEHRKPVRISFN